MSELLRESDPASQQVSSPSPSPESKTYNEQNDSESGAAEKKTPVKETNTEAVQEEEPFFDFQMFINDLKNPKAEPLVKYTRSFLSNFVTQKKFWTAEEQEKLVRNFKVFIYGKFSEFEPFNTLDRAKLNNAQEGLEKLIMGKLYPFCFSPELASKIDIEELDESHKNDVLNDQFLEDKIAEYSFIELDNLDVPNKISTKLSRFLRLAGKELNKINHFKAPRDKMVCILNSCKVIFGILRHFKLDKDGADSFIPLLIYVIIHGNVTKLVSNVKYIERFRYEKFLKSEDQYYLSSLQAATNFIINLNRKDLTIKDEIEFDAQYTVNQETQKKLREEKELKQKQEQEASAPPLTESPYNPIDDITSSMVSMFSDFFTNAASTPAVAETDGSTAVPTPTPTSKAATPKRRRSSHNRAKDDLFMQTAVKKMEEDEQAETVESLVEMFPDLPPELIEDICIAKKYRTGVCVDTLLNLYE